MRTYCTYLQSGYYNVTASASPTGASAPISGLPISTGRVLGDFEEVTDGQAAQGSSPLVGTLYSGRYQWVQLDPAVATVAKGQALFWNRSVNGSNWLVTTTELGYLPDFAGIVIDPNMSAALPYALIQISGRATVKYRTALTNGTPAVNDAVFLAAAGAGADNATFDDPTAATAVTAASLRLYAGTAVTVPVAAGLGTVELREVQARY